jgi:hypothetical protein
MEQSNVQEFFEKVKALEQEYGIELRAAIAQEYLLSFTQAALNISESVLALAKNINQIPVQITLNLAEPKADNANHSPA